MIGSTRAVRVWVYPAPCDLRTGFDGLSHLVSWQLGKEPTSGECFLFVNRRRQSCKVLLWDGTGLAIYKKRLETGCFARLWGGAVGEPVRLTSSELALHLEGSQLVGTTKLSPDEFIPRKGSS